MNDWSVTAYIMKRDYARKVIERYCRNDGYDLTIPGTDFYPMPETVLFYNIGKVYAVDLFVESSQFQSTFVKEVDIHDGIKEYHGESYNFVSNWWIKNGDRTTLEKLLGVKPSEELTEIEIFLRDFSLDTENAYANFNMGLWYEKQGHTAPALSYFLRSAERSEDDDFTYESLLKCHHCYYLQGTRDMFDAKKTRSIFSSG
jgi:hypothetical protein